jgi:RNA methyltransferase, TrmH family
MISGSRKVHEDLVLAEGTRVLQEVNQSTHSIDAVVLSEYFGSDEREERLLREWESRKIRLFKVTEKLFESISCLQSPQGAVALVNVPKVSFPLMPGSDSLILYACGIQDPGNLGTIIRTAAAAGATLVCTSRGTVSARNPKTIRSSSGAFFKFTPAEHVDAYVFYRYCIDHSIRLYRTDIRCGVSYIDSDFKSPCAILLGNEGSGMNEEIFEDLTAIRIPMTKGIESLNVAQAGAVILFEASRQRSLYSSHPSASQI